MPSNTDREYAALAAKYGAGKSMNDYRLLHYFATGTNKSVADAAYDIFAPGNALSIQDKSRLYFGAASSESVADAMQKFSFATGGIPASPQVTIAALLALPQFTVGHRGSGDVVPEHTIPAYQLAVDGGIQALEMSAQRNAQGTWFMLHDTGATGLDRTTTRTGNPALLTDAEVATTNVIDSRLGQYWDDNRPLMPFLNTVVQAFYNKVVWFLESKDYTGAAQDALISLIQANLPGYTSSIIWKIAATNTTGIAKGKAAGMKVWAYLTTVPLSTAELDAAIAAGADYIGVPVYNSNPGSTLSDADITTVIGRGKPVFMWPASRRYIRASKQALGVKGFVSAQAKYTDITTALLTQDTFASGKWAMGDHGLATDRTAIIPGDGTMYMVGTAGNPAVMMGSMCPAGGAATTYSIEFEVMYTAIPATTTQSVGIAFGKTDDSPYEFQATTNTPGYHCILRANGQLQLYTHVNGTATGTQIGTTVTTNAMVANQWAKIKVTVDPTNVTFQRLDGTPSTPQAVANTANRGKYFHLCRNHGTNAGEAAYVKFRNVKVT